MLKVFSKLILVFTFNMIVSIPLYAQLVKQKELNFQIKTENLLKGEVHYFIDIVSPRKLSVQYPDTFDLDSLLLIQESNVVMALVKSVYVVNKPVGFFDQDQILEEKYLAHVLGEQKIKKLNPNTFLVTVPGKDGYEYRMQTFFDADDLSTLPNSKIISAVSAAKKLDVISQGASTIMFTEFTNYTKFTEGGVAVSSHIPLKEDKTLIITYKMWAVKKEAADPVKLQEGILSEVQATPELINSFK